LKNKAIFLAALLGLLAPLLRADDRNIEICTSQQASDGIKKGAADLVSGAGNVPLFKALIAAGDANSIVSKTSEGLMDPKAFNEAAHNHLVVIGLASQDSLLQKIWGYTTTIDEGKKSVYAEGWGYMSGDIGWVESDRNPFLHSQRIRTVPEDTIIVKISGTSEAGVLAALTAFQGGLLNGFVVSGAMLRPQTTLLDLDPQPAPAPFTLPATVQTDGKTATLAGWSEVPAAEYRGVLEKSQIEPKCMWRYKYLNQGILEQRPDIRWLGSVHSKAFGNAVDVIQFNSEQEAQQAASSLAAGNFTPDTLDGKKTWTAPMASDVFPVGADSFKKEPPFWNVTVTASGPYVFLSSLPAEETVHVAEAAGP
jgi:hypothetical protein